MIKAKYTTKQKEAIGDRDNWCCIICGTNTNLQFHHTLFGTESIYTKDRNDPKYGVTICATDHLKAHSCSKGEGVRQQCIDYTLNI